MGSVFLQSYPDVVKLLCNCPVDLRYSFGGLTPGAHGLRRHCANCELCHCATVAARG